jgi:hypothetical protein
MNNNGGATRASERRKYWIVRDMEEGAQMFVPRTSNKACSLLATEKNLDQENPNVCCLDGDSDSNGNATVRLEACRTTPPHMFQ